MYVYLFIFGSNCILGLLELSNNFLSAIYKYPVRINVEILESNYSLAKKSQDKLVVTECEVSPGSFTDSGS